MGDSSHSVIPALDGLAVESVEWLPSGAESGLVRVRGRWVDEAARQPELPVLALRAGGGEHRFDSLPDARFSRDPSSWRGTYLVPAELVTVDPEALWLEWAGGARSGLPALARGVEPPPVPGAPRVEPAEEPGGQVIDRAVLAERRARRAEAAEQHQARVAAEALKAVEVLELRSAELERRLSEATAERDALAGRQGEAGARRDALDAALASAAELRARSREWRLRLRTSEVARASDAVRLAVLENERATTAPALREALAAASAAAGEAQAALGVAEQRLAESDQRRAALEASLERVRGDLAAARDQAATAVRELEATLATTEARLGVETVARTTLEDELDRERAHRAELHAALEAAQAEVMSAATDLTATRAELATARSEAAAARDLRTDLGAARAELETARSDAAAARDLRTDLNAARAELETARSEAAAANDLRAHLDAARAELETERVAAGDRRGELEIARSEAATARGALADLRAELETERSARRGEAATLQDRIAELERRAASGRDELERLAREQAEAAAARGPAAGSAQVVADLDAAADSLRRRPEPPAPDAAADSLRRRTEAPAPDAEPDAERPEWPHADAPAEPAEAPADPPRRHDEPTPGAAAPARIDPAAPDVEPPVEWSAPADEPCAPDAEPAVEWSEPFDDGDGRKPVTPAAEPRREGVDDPDVAWAHADFVRAEESVEPPAPDAEPFVEATPPESMPPPATSSSEPALLVASASPVGATPAEAAAAAAPSPDAAAAPVEPAAGPKIVPASGPPPRALIIGTDRRDYPLLRGALVKLAHDDADTAARMLTALLPAQGTLIEGPLAYDLTIAGAGTFGIAVAGGRATVEPLERPRSRRDAEFHLTADALVLAELLAGVDHRIGRFFGPARVRGRRRRVKALRAITNGSATLTDVARAGARLDPELVYRTFAYAVHPTWTKGRAFTIAQTIEQDPPETWYLTARDGAGLTVSRTPPAPPQATVTMTRDTFDRLLRAEPLPTGTRPAIRGDRHAVELMRAWTERARQ